VAAPSRFRSIVVQLSKVINGLNFVTECIILAAKASTLNEPYAHIHIVYLLVPRFLDIHYFLTSDCNVELNFPNISAHLIYFVFYGLDF